LFLLAGCFQVSTVDRVNPDGRCTVVETMLLSKKMIARMNEMMQGFAGESGAKPEPVDLFDSAKLKSQAAGMGEGISYLSGEKTESAEYSGYTATYAFKDINTLRLNQQGGESAGRADGQKAPSMPLLCPFQQGLPGNPYPLSSQKRRALQRPTKRRQRMPRPSQPRVSSQTRRRSNWWRCSWE
jgi:hypothetical protein